MARALFVALAACRPVAALAASPVVAAPAGEFATTAPPLRHPTDITVSPAGDVFVVDGVNDRVVRFHADGRLASVLTHAGDAALHRPLGIDSADDGAIWIADTGNRRIVALSATGDLIRQIDLSQPDSAGVDIADVVLLGNDVWFTDNDHNRIGRIGPRSTEPQWYGESGRSLGRFEYPFLIAAAPNHELFVSESINARVAVWSAAGRPIGVIGRYGADLGDLYRPKGVAIDTHGRAWVADGVLGVIQVFRADGKLIDVCRTADEEPLRLSAPCGLAFDADGRLYVVEMAAHRARRFEITAQSSAAPRTRAAPAAASPAQSRGCTVCHLEWLQPLSRNQPTQLISPPRSTKEDPAVARQDVCLSCHDGSLVDSRRRVWHDQGHPHDVAPPDGMTIPDNLPLVDGRVTCRTCHSAHTRGGAGGDFREAVFLRVDKQPAELCVACHAQTVTADRLRSHPVDPSLYPPHDGATADEADASNSPTPDKTTRPDMPAATCLTCHEGHGRRPGLLRRHGQDQLCTDCHTDQAWIDPSPGNPSSATGGRHPMGAALTDAQLTFAQSHGTRVGDDRTLQCLTCHRMHEAVDRPLLACGVGDPRSCTQCHAEQAAVFGSVHDLREHRPDERNLAGFTPSESGACRVCHGVHAAARNPAPHALDQAGACRTCHQSGACASEESLADFNHPAAQCTECHDPHAAANPGFLLEATPETLCVSCHADMASLRNGPHDAMRRPGAWPADAAVEKDRCLSCHRPHGDKSQGLWRVSAASGGMGGDDACLACHASADWNIETVGALLHPRQPGRNAESMSAAAAKRLNADGHLACRTCHNPHGGIDQGAWLLHVSSGQDSVELCFDCHADMRAIAQSGHAPASLARAGLDSDACLPCHTIHARTTGDRPWPMALRGAISAPPPHVPDASCAACHQEDGPAAAPVVARHPELAMLDPRPLDSNSLPLFAVDGSRSASGSITCETCHVPHGRPLDRLAETGEATPPRAARNQIRPFVAPNACTTCHGGEALGRYLYFHLPGRAGRR
jgi:predicted CXXCH cytochrome family protein